MKLLLKRSVAVLTVILLLCGCAPLGLLSGLPISARAAGTDAADDLFDPACFAEESGTYNDALADFCAQCVLHGYNDSNAELETFLNGIGLTDVRIRTWTRRDQVNCFFAHGWIEAGQKPVMLVLAACIGSHRDQWYSNFDPLGWDRSSDTPEDGDAETDAVHLGFADARDFVYGILRAYIADLHLSRGQVKLLLTGHSRGGAAANLLAAKIAAAQDDVFPCAEDLYIYTFATPNAAKTQKIQADEALHPEWYQGIYNIVNPEDFVTKVLPSAWGYGRYGTTYTLPSRTNDADYETYLRLMRKAYTKLDPSGVRYEPYGNGEADVYNLLRLFTDRVGGVTDGFYSSEFFAYYSGTSDYKTPVVRTPYAFFRDTVCAFCADTNDEDAFALMKKILAANMSGFYARVLSFFVKFGSVLNPVASLSIAQAHRMETYAAYMFSMSGEELQFKRGGYYGCVVGPVDVEVYVKGSQTPVGRIADGAVGTAIAPKTQRAVMLVDGESKRFWLPSDGAYEVRLTGTADGTADCSVSVIDSDTGETERVNFFDVAVSAGGTAVCRFFGADFDTADAALYTDSGELPSTETLRNDDLCALRIQVTVKGKGFAESVSATRGDPVTLNAFGENGKNRFLGWYEDGVLVCRDAAYAFTAKANRNLTAWFSAEAHTIRWICCGDVTEQFAETGDTIVKPADPVTEGWTFVGWTPDVPDVMPAEDLTFTAQFRQNEAPSVVGKVYGVTAADLTLYYGAEDMLRPIVAADADAVCTVSYGGFDSRIISVDANGKVTALKKGSTTVTVTVTDNAGNTAECVFQITVRYTWLQILMRIFLFGFLWMR